MRSPGLYGVLGEFATADGLLAAAKAAHGEGHFLEAYTPFAVEGLGEAIGFTRNRMPLFTFVGGLLGAVGTYALQWYSAVVSYPINAGGRPLDSWPAFVPATFAVTLLAAALAAVVGMLASNGLPCLRHPLFEIREFDLASRNRFFLCLRPSSAAFDADRASAFLEAQHAIKVWAVPR